MTTIANSQIREKVFRGRAFKFVCVQRHTDGLADASWWSFTDEDAIREEFWHIAPGDVVLDIGAAYGSYALTALACGASHVFAWSPQGHPGAPASEKEAAFMRATLALNGWSDRCSIFEEGLYSKSGWVNAETQQFFDEEPPWCNDIVRVRTPSDWLQSIGGPAALFRSGPAPLWVKIDTEGAEIEILKGLLDPIIAPFSPKIQVENHIFKKASLEDDARDLILSWGYVEVATKPYGALSHSFYVPG